MKKVTKQYDAFTEHYLVPAALFLLNVSLVHTIYAYANGSWNRPYHLAAITVSLIAFVSALRLKKRGYLWFAIGYYLLLLTYCLVIA